MHEPLQPTRDASTQLPLPRRELRGVVERITYQNPENSYTVARLAPLASTTPKYTLVVLSPGSAE